MSDAVPILEVREVQKYFPIRGGFLAGLLSDGKERYVRALEATSLTLEAGQSLGIVGESGCGKTTLAKTLIRLYTPTSGEIKFEGRDITALSGRALHGFRRKAQMIFQDPFESLNPRFTVGQILLEPLAVHRLGGPSERKDRAMEMLSQMGLTPAKAIARRYPHELSGGQRQRVAIGRALITDPSLVIADEPVSMLDVSLRAGLMDTLLQNVQAGGRASIYISHDLSIIRHMCDITAVMYLGRIIEMGPTETLIAQPSHPYTQALVKAVPTPDPDRRFSVEISGNVPDATREYVGCPFVDRCPERQAVCSQVRPPLDRKAGYDGRRVACHMR